MTASCFCVTLWILLTTLDLRSVCTFCRCVPFFLIFQVKWKKLQPPTQRITILGYEYCTLTQTISLPLEKRVRLNQLLAGHSKYANSRSCFNPFDPSRRSTIRRKELEKLLGSLNDAARIIWPGRILLKRAYKLIYTVEKPTHHINLKKIIRDDLKIFREFLHSLVEISLPYVIRDFTRIQSANFY